MNARILIAVTHLLGIGHLVRARQLAQVLAGAGHQVTLASGGMPDGKAAADYRSVQLPPVRTQGTDFRNLLAEADIRLYAAKNNGRDQVRGRYGFSIES